LPVSLADLANELRKYKDHDFFEIVIEVDLNHFSLPSCRSDRCDDGFIGFAKRAIIDPQIEAGFLRFDASNNNGLPHLEQGGRRLSTNLYFGTSAIALNS
jgi:hypothetical protein